MIQHALNYVGIATAAASGAVLGIRKQFDLFGIAALAVLTGVGGGVLRDMLLGVDPPRSLQHWSDVVVCLIVAAVATIFTHAVIKLSQPVLMLDAVGMGFFATSGAALAVDHGAGAFAAVLLGLVNALAGVIIRDVLARETPQVLGPDDMYAVPALLGSVLYVAVDAVGPQWVGVAAGSLVATALRLAAIRFHWRLPTGRHEVVADAERQEVT